MRLTMDYEKAYKNALERARKINSGEGVPAPPGYSVCETIFPELKKSEDEKIRKAILELVKQSSHILNPMNQKSMIAWLEKQGEKSWSEEDEDILDIAIRIIQNGGDDCAGILDSNKALRWLKSLKDRVQPQQKQEWSKYDKIQLSEAIQMIEANGTWIRSEDAVKKVSNWLKSIKPQNHWKPTKEQLKALRNLLSGSFSMDNSKTYQSIESLYNDLKSL